MGVLEASRTQYIFISQITTTRGINLKNSWYITMDGMVDDPALKDLPACTMEIRMYGNEEGVETLVPSAMVTASSESR